MGKVVIYKTNFTLLKDNNDYEKKIHNILKKFQSENLSNKVARKWIARSICEVYEQEASNITDKEIEERRMAI